MKESEDALTVIIFRGARANPWRLKIPKFAIKHGLIWGGILLVLQIGIVTHYVYQWNQLSELENVKQELTVSRTKTSNFSTEVEGMKKRMLTLETLNRKLQTMFGLEPSEIQGLSEGQQGQGGEELPYDHQEDGGQGIGGEEPMGEPVSGEGPASAVSIANRKISKIQTGLNWLGQQSKVEKDILDELSKVAEKKATQWAHTPSIWPVKGSITSRFGPRVSPFTGKKTLHAGLDIGARKGTSIFAPASGKVVVAAYDGRMGKFIRVDHGYGIETTYGHLSKILVKYGDRVQRGDLIGLVGSTGKFSTGPHLHYQIAVNDKVVNPVDYILD